MSEQLVTNAERNQRVQTIINDIFEGKIKRDTLTNAALQFDKEAEAAYFSHMRRNMDSDMAVAVMHQNQQLDDLSILKALGKRA